MQLGKSLAGLSLNGQSRGTMYVSTKGGSGSYGYQ